MNFNKFVTNKEIVYFSFMLAFSIICYLILLISVVGLVYVFLFAMIFFFAQVFSIGHLKHNAVRISENQFPDIYEKIKNYSNKLELKKIPDVYLVQSGGLLNAFATRFCCRDFVIIYSDVLELAYEQGENAVNFIVAHELAHVYRGHLTKAKWIACGQLIPFLNTAYSRACEYTCDNIASALVPEANTEGLLTLIAGKKLYKNVNVENLLKDSERDAAWTWLAEIYSTHPNLINRIKNLQNNFKKAERECERKSTVLY